MLVSQSAKALEGLTLVKSWNRIKQINTIDFLQSFKTKLKIIS